MSNNDPFRHNSPGLESPAIALTTITPSDSDNQPRVLRAIYAGQGGNIVVTDTEGNTVTFAGVLPGATIGPFRVARVRATGTTASALVGMV